MVATGQEAFFNQMAKGKARAYSAETQPTDKVNPVVIVAMKEIGIDISSNKPKPLTMDMAEKGNKITAMGCGNEAVCPTTFVETEDWQLEDPVDKTLEEVRKIRDEINRRATKLLEEITETMDE